MKTNPTRDFAAVAATRRVAAGGLLIFLATQLAAAVPQQLHGHVPAAIAQLVPSGWLPVGQPLELVIGLPLRNQPDLAHLLQQLYDPASTNFHRHLTPAQFTERFGPTVEDYQKLLLFARTNGLTVTGTHPGRTLLDVHGTVGDIEKTFHVALYELEGYYPSDITTYETRTGLPSVTVQNVPIKGFGFLPVPTDTNGVLEVSLDIEVAIAMAPGLSKVLVYGATNGFGFDQNILLQMADDDAAQQISSSWGINVNSSIDQIFQQFAVQGQSFFMAVGDNDAYVGAIPQGVDDPYLTVVGGTESTTGSSADWQSEIVWNYNNTGQTPANKGTGGGISTQYAIPLWQQSVSMAANQGPPVSGTFRTSQWSRTTSPRLPEMALIITPGAPALPRRSGRA
jgi:subtilase family serine protease